MPSEKRSLDSVDAVESAAKRDKVTDVTKDDITDAEGAQVPAAEQEQEQKQEGKQEDKQEQGEDSAASEIASGAESAPAADVEASAAKVVPDTAAGAPAGAAGAAAAAVKEDAATAATTPGAIAATVAAAQADSAAPTEYTMPVEVGLVGSVIGRAGAAIRSVRDATGANVSVNSQDQAVGGYRTLKITGTQTQIYMAYNMVQEQLKKGREEAVARAARGMSGTGATGGGGGGGAAAGQHSGNPGDVTVTMLVPRDAVGGLIGRGGGTIAQLRSNSGCSIRVADQNEAGTEQRLVTITGRPEACQYAQQLVNAKMAANMAAGGNNGQPGGSAMVPGGSTVSIQVPNDVIGRIIGKGGSAINELRAASGAKVDIPKADAGGAALNSMRVISITGTPQQVQMAQYLIGQKQQEHLNHGGGGGGGAPPAMGGGAYGQPQYGAPAPYGMAMPAPGYGMPMGQPPGFGMPQQQQPFGQGAPMPPTSY